MTQDVTYYVWYEFIIKEMIQTWKKALSVFGEEKGVCMANHLCRGIS